MTSPSFTTDPSLAAELDAQDPLSALVDEFEMPIHHDGTDEIYLVGNSLGVVPKPARAMLLAEMDRWSTAGHRGHFDPDDGWVGYHRLLSASMANIVGALPHEVACMNALTVNLHLLMVSFYNPTPERHKILIEDHAFPSDHFAVESQIRMRGFDPADSMIIVAPREGETRLRHEDIVAAIDDNAAELALVMLPGIHYYTGQVLDMPGIVAAAHAHNIPVGLDLAHAAGNVVMHLHDWDVDFAAWCTYKYLNSGPGGIGAAYVHERHHQDQSLHKLLGWWGTKQSTRFEMVNDFEPIPTVDSWVISNSPILILATLRGSLQMFDRAGGMVPLRAKAEQQIAYLDFLLAEVIGDRVENLSAGPLAERGCQFSLRVTSPSHEGQEVHAALEEAGVACDWRFPDVIRVAPVPLYTTFADIRRFVTVLDGLLS